MLWFKHKTDMSANPQMRHCIRKHGIAAYAVWNIFLEEVCRWGHDEPLKPRSKSRTWRATFEPEVIAEKCFMSCADVVKLLRYLMDIFGVSLESENSLWTVSYCKILEIRDDYSKRKVRTMFGQCSDNVRVDTEKDKEEDKEEDKDKIYAREFDRFWETYPPRNGKRLGKQKTYSKFKKLKPEQIPQILKAVTHYAQSSSARTGYAKDPFRFLEAEFWIDWLEPEKEPPNTGPRTYQALMESDDA